MSGVIPNQSYKDLLDRLPFGVAVSTEGGIEYYNPRAMEMLGIEEADIPHMKPEDVYDDPRDRQVLLRALRETGHYEYEIWARRANGERFRLRGRSVAVTDAETGVERFEGYMEDVMARHQAEAALLRDQDELEVVVAQQSADLGEAESRYQTLFEFAPVMYVVTSATPEGPVVVDCNRSFLGALGYSRKSVVGRQLAEFYDEASRARLLGGGYDLALSGVFVAEERGLLTREGKSVPVLLRAQPLRSPMGEVTGMLAAFVDVTDEKRDQAMRQSLQYLRERILRMQAPEEIQEILHETRRTIGDLGVPFENMGINLVRSSEPPTVRFNNMTRDGKWFEAAGDDSADILVRIWRAGNPAYRRDLHASDPFGDRPSIRNSHGFDVRSVLDVPFTHGTLAVNSTRPDAFTEADVKILQQITEVLSVAFRRLDDLEGLKATQRQLQQTQRLEAVGRLAGGIAHDFHNILTVIQMSCDFIRRKLDGEHPCQPLAAQIGSAVDQATRLVRQLLAFSKRQIVAPVPLQVNTVIAELEKMLKRLLGEDVSLVTDLDPDLGLVLADPAQVEQVLMNLVANARDAMPGGGRITIQTRGVALTGEQTQRLSPLAAGDHVLVRVTDTGCGMDPETQDRIFEPFFTTKEAGTGLGLATVYGIVSQGHGHVRVDSRVGHGTTFEVYLPRQGAATAAGSSLGGLARLILGGSGVVLVVEDDAAVRKLVCMTLEEAGYTTLAADCGEAALDLARDGDQPIDLLLCDVVMPGLSGPDVAEKIRSHRPGLAILWTSGHVGEALERTRLDLHSEDYLPKPLTPHALTAKVAEILGRTRRL